MRIIRSVRDARGNIIQKQPPGGAGRLKCPKCQRGVCSSKQMPNGKRIMSCTSCGASYVVGSMDRPHVAQPGSTLKPRASLPTRHR
jgi:hypothetical protein